MTVTVVYTGTNDPIVHAAGCRDLDKLKGASRETFEATTFADVAAVVYQDMIDDDTTADDFTGDLDVKPCAHLHI